MHDTDPYFDPSIFETDFFETDFFETDPEIELELDRDTAPRRRCETTLPGMGPRFQSTLPGTGGSRRVEHRFTFRAEVEAIPLDGRQEGILGYTEDICHRGVFIKARVSLALDSLVVLKLNTDHGTLKVTGRVVHNIVGMGFGCEFIDLDERQRTSLRLLVSVRAMAIPRNRTLH